MLTCYLNKEQSSGWVGCGGLIALRGSFHDLKVPAQLLMPLTKAQKTLFSLHERVLNFYFEITLFLNQSLTFRETHYSCSICTSFMIIVLFLFGGESLRLAPRPRVALAEAPPAEGRDLWVPNPQRGVCCIELVIWSDRGCSLVTRVLIQTDVKMNTLNSGDQ